MIMPEKLGKYIEASLIGAGRGLIALPLEHPLDTIKTKSQATPEIKSSWEVASKIYQTAGIRGFYAGAVPNGIRLAIKQMYRYPMMLAFPKVFKENFPTNFQKRHPDAVPLSTALSIATFETYIICPLERCKVVLMTSDAKGHPLRDFFRSHQGHLRSALFRGITTVYVRQIVAWGSFLLADKRAKDWERKRTQTQQLSFQSLMLVSLIVGSVNTAANMPFDAAKTSLQKRDPFQDTNLLKTLKKIYEHHGIHGMYAGWKPRMIQYMLQSAFTVTILDKLERSWSAK